MSETGDVKISALGTAGSERRTPLTRERVVAAAIELADRDGIESISMRKVAHELGVEAMSLYTHVRNKNDLVGGMADAVITEIPIGTDQDDWKTALRQLVLSARSIVLRHPWAARTLESQTELGPGALWYVNALIGILRNGGFSIAQVHHALHILGSRALGFTHAVFDDSGELAPDAAAALVSQLANSHPFVVEIAVAATHDGALGRCDDDAEFAFALDFILDGLARMRSN